MPKLSQQDQSVVDRLRSTHADYEGEQVWHRFLLDSYAGTGGYAGRVRMPFSSFWGSAAEDYGTSLSPSTTDDLNDTESQIDTYLERFPREDVKKFARRAAVSQFPNYCEPIVDLRHSYLNRKPMGYEGVEALQGDETAWWSNVGEGKTWDELMTTVVRMRALVLGWFPMLVDAPPAPSGLSVAQAKEAGVRARCIPLFPSNLLEWAIDEDTGAFQWVKLRTCHVRRATFMAEPVRVERFAVWSATSVVVDEVHTSANGDEELVRIGERPHGFGEVPIVIFRAKPVPADRFRGLSIISGAAPMNRKLFNYLSEYDEHLRSCVFGMLQAPVNDPKAKGVVVVGNANILPIAKDSTRDYRWIAPDGSVATTYEARVLKQIDEIHRVGRNESGGTKQVAKSGVAQAYSFEGMNRAISDNAVSLATGEQRTLRLVARVEAPATDAAKIRVIPASKFDVEEMAKELEEVLTALDLDLGVTATAKLKQRIARKLLPNLSDEEMAEIDQEIEQRADEQAQEAAAMREMLAAGGQDPAGQDPQVDPADPEADPEADPATPPVPPKGGKRKPPAGPVRPGERTAPQGKPKARAGR